MQQSPGLNSDEIIDTVKDQFFKDFRTNGGGGGLFGITDYILIWNEIMNDIKHGLVEQI